jgi:hypothetical protein
MTVAPGGKLPTQSACPDCFGFRGGPLGMAPRLVSGPWCKTATELEISALKLVG